MKLVEGCGELLLPSVVELERALWGLGSKNDSLGGDGVDIVVIEILLIRPERDTVYYFTLHSGCLFRPACNQFYAASEIVRHLERHILLLLSTRSLSICTDPLLEEVVLIL